MPRKVTGVLDIDLGKDLAPTRTLVDCPDGALLRLAPFLPRAAHAFRLGAAHSLALVAVRVGRAGHSEGQQHRTHDHETQARSHRGGPLLRVP